MHAWFDISAGVAGDMLLGSLLDAGADAAAVQRAIDAVAPGSVRLDREDAVRGGQRGTKARVRVLVDDPPHRSWASIRARLADADLSEETRARALAAFGRLAAAEGRVHGVDPGTVHFHEVGALDSMADVVGTCEALRTLGVTSVSASPVRLGSGRVRAAHGDIPVPVPAVAELALGWQVCATPEQDAPGHHHHEHGHDHGDRDHTHDHGGHEHAHDHGDHDHAHDHEGHVHASQHDTPAQVTTEGSVGELATPTGLALIRALAGRCEPMPALTLERVGIGAGSKDFAGWPNVVRVMIGSPVDGSAAPGSQVADGGPAVEASREEPATEVAELQANVDDLDPRLWPSVLDDCLAAGALDAWLAPIHMKRGRPAFTLHALAPRSAADAVADVMLTRTSTLGVREVLTRRRVLDRGFLTLELDGVPLTVKVGSRGGIIVHAAAEFSSLVSVAEAGGRPLSDVTQRATGAIVAAGLVAGNPVPAEAAQERRA
ncbi:LarC family nickel insertion protein [Nigerium massiliense]|uniref:LarC family nickel insertion protein n=1 Tax=Nigerium massiliense TaxID=1522317 RepID=UPI0005905769|nr:LarC family nickel insertion protein [Nigerium massiliense]